MSLDRATANINATFGFVLRRTTAQTSAPELGAFCFCFLLHSESSYFPSKLGKCFFSWTRCQKQKCWLQLSLRAILHIHTHTYIHTCIHIYIHICCEVIIWAKFGHFRCYYLGQVGVIIWAKLFLAYKSSGFKRFFAHTIIILCFFCVQLSGNYLKIAFFKKGCKNWVFQYCAF